MAAKKYNKGNTLPFALIALIIVSIIALAVTYMVYQNSVYRIQKSNRDFLYADLGSKAYEVINSANDYYLTNSSFEGFSVDADYITKLIVTGSRIDMTARDDKNGLEIIISVNYTSGNYAILDWEYK